MPSFDLGEQTIGGFPSSIEGSTVDPLAGLLSDPSAEREFLLRGKPALAEPFSLAFTTSPASYINLSVYTATASFTLECLFWSTTLGTLKVIAAKKTDTGVSEGWALYFDASNVLSFVISDGVNRFLVTFPAVQLLDGMAHRVSVMLRRTDFPTDISMFVDGSLVAISGSITSLGVVNPAINLRIGSFSGGASNWVGNLSDFRLWPGATRDQGIIDKQKYSQLSTSELLGALYVKMNEGTGSFAGGYPITGAAWSLSPGRVLVDLSTSGYLSKPTDTPYQLFTGAIARPYNFSVNLPLPDLIGGSSLGVGELVVNNPDGLRDRDSMLDWLGADADMYIGRRSDALTAFTRFSKGKAAGVTRGIDRWSLLYRDLRFKLQKRLQPNRYRGTGAAVRFDLGAGEKVGYGNVLNKTATDSFTIEMLLSSSAVGAFKGLACKGTHGLIGYEFYFDNGNLLTAYISNGTTLVSTPGISGLLDGVTRRLTWVVDRTAQLMFMYVNGVLSATSPTISTVTGTLLNAIALNVGAFSDGSNVMSGLIDDFRSWPVARTQQQIRDTMDRELTATEATACSVYTKFNEGTGTSASDSSGNTLTGTITGSVTWASTLDGDSAIAGKPKPLAFGKRRQVAPVLVDSQRLVYQLHDGSMAGVDAVRIAGDPMTFGSNLADIYSSAPAAGQYTTSLTKGLIRLGTAPGAAQVTADIRGDNAGALGYLDTAGGIHKKIATQFGGLSDPADIDGASYTALNAKNSATTGLYFIEEINVDAALDDAVKSINAWWSPSRVATSVVGRIDAPESQTASVSITSDDMVDGEYSDEPVGVGRVGQVVLGYRPYAVIMSPDQVAGAVSLANRDDFGRDYRTVTATDPAKTADADVLLVKTNIDDAAAAQAEADRLLALWKVNRRIYKRELDTGLLSYFIGTVFSLTYPRYDTADGKNLIAVGIEEDIGEFASADSIKVTLFG